MPPNHKAFRNCLPVTGVETGHIHPQRMGIVLGPLRLTRGHKIPNFWIQPNPNLEFSQIQNFFDSQQSESKPNSLKLTP